jgi:zinc protease
VTEEYTNEKDILYVKLDNGLTVILKEMNHATFSTLYVWYKAGSRYESPGKSGVFHWIEHLLSRGTPSFSKEKIAQLITKDGGNYNSFVWLDFTTYFTTLPTNSIHLAFEIEADRMINAQFRPEDIEIERKVITAERKMNESNPNFILGERVRQIAFKNHPYRYQVIGNGIDINKITPQDLIDYYHRFYVPNNSVIVAAGNFNSHLILNIIKRYFNDIPPLDTGYPPVITEIFPTESQRVLVQGSGDTSYLCVSFRVPEATHKDFIPLVLFNAAFVGGSSLPFYSGAGNNRISRLYKSTVEKGLAVGLIGSIAPTIDSHLYSLNAVINQGSEISKVVDVIQTELELVRKRPISGQELYLAKKRAKVGLALIGERVTGQAQMIGIAEIVAGNYLWFDEMLEKIRAVTEKDLDRVIHKYLKPENWIIGEYIPSREKT